VLKEKDKPFLQGWGIVENPSDEDWSNVRLTLVSGRPVSFQMDLYQPLYVPRPMQQLELFASLQPRVYGGAVEKPAATAGTAGAPAPKEVRELEQLGRQAGLGAKRDEARRLLREAKPADDTLNLQEGIAAAATAAQLGDFFQYAIDSPVNLPRQKSALIPILNDSVQGARVSIYNENVQAKFPMLGLKLTNSTGLHLMQGPLTVYEGNSYAGDALIPDLEPKEERLLSYAIDLGTEVDPVAKRQPDRLVALKVHKGILFTTTKIQESKNYTLKNRSDQERTVLIEHPYRPDFHLVSKAQPAERSRDVYRFEVKVPAGQSASLEVTEEQDQVQTVALNNSDNQQMQTFLSSTVADPKLKEALKGAVERKERWLGTQRQREEADKQASVLVADQGRVRANLKEVPPNSELAKRYLDKLNSQETELEKLQAQVQQLQAAESQQRQQYESYLSSLEVE